MEGEENVVDLAGLNSPMNSHHAAATAASTWWSLTAEPKAILLVHWCGRCVLDWVVVDLDVAAFEVRIAVPAKLHARGPMGLAELCSYKYLVFGSGQIRG